MKAVNNLQLFLKGLIFKVQNMSDYAVALKTKNLLNYDQTGMYKNQIWQNYKKWTLRNNMHYELFAEGWSNDWLPVDPRGQLVLIKAIVA